MFVFITWFGVPPHPAFSDSNFCTRKEMVAATRDVAVAVTAETRTGDVLVTGGGVVVGGSAKDNACR